MKGVTFIVVVLSLTLWPGDPATATTHAPVGRWKLDENPIGAEGHHPRQHRPSQRLTPRSWSGSAAAPLASTGSGAVFFPGWTRLEQSGTVARRASFGVTGRLHCSLRDRVITSKVTTSGVSDVYTAPGPRRVVNAQAIWVGKKPGSTNPGDAFAGRLDDLIISKSG